MRIWVIEYLNGKEFIRIAKRSKEEAISWFESVYPNKVILNIYEQ